MYHQSYLLRASGVHGHIHWLKRHPNLQRPRECSKIARLPWQLLAQGAWSPQHLDPFSLLKRWAVISVAYIQSMMG